MILEDQSTLSVLESLSAGPDLHQRKIAESTGLNLAKVNFVLKKLVDKGMVKLQRVRDNPHKRRYLYLLTPAGVAEKSRLTYHFIKRSMQSYQEAERKVAEAIESMAAQDVKRVVLWGNTEITEMCLSLFEKLAGGIVVLGVVDESGAHKLAMHPERVAVTDADAIFVCDDSARNLPSNFPIWRIT
jgi:MarR family transcriptional regulator, temperature-dependent positive regulator of motility